MKMKKRLICGLALIFTLFFVNHTYALCVKVSVANLRDGPGTNYGRTWQVFKYMPFKEITKKGNWYKVKDVDGDVHWIFKKLVTDKFKCAAVKVEKANIRSGPGTEFRKNIIGPAIKYDSFKVIKMQGTWVKVRDEYDDTGWIFKKLLWIQ